MNGGAVRRWRRAIVGRASAGTGPSPRPPGDAERLERQNRRIRALELDLARIGPQVAALEARVEDLRFGALGSDVRSGEVAEAVSLVEEVRREHERMRARVSAAIRFEERLGRLEEQMATISRPH
jgi:hypothetical protein